MSAPHLLWAYEKVQNNVCLRKTYEYLQCARHVHKPVRSAFQQKRKKTLPSKSIYSLKPPLFTLWLSSNASIQEQIFVNVLQQGSCGQIWETFNQNKLPILVNVFKFALKECSLSVSLWSFNGLLGLGVLLPNSLWHVAIQAMLPVQKIFE